MSTNGSGMPPEEVAEVRRERDYRANQIAYYVADGTQVPDRLLNEWKQLDNRMSAHLGAEPHWQVDES